MARRCSLTGKKPLVGNRVSHSNRKTKRRQLPNIKDKRIYVAELDRWVRVRLSTRALRTVHRKGLMSYLRESGLALKDIAR